MGHDWPNIRYVIIDGGSTRSKLNNVPAINLTRRWIENVFVDEQFCCRWPQEDVDSPVISMFTQIEINWRINVLAI